MTIKYHYPRGCFYVCIIIIARNLMRQLLVLLATVGGVVAPFLRSSMTKPSSSKSFSAGIIPCGTVMSDVVTAAEPPSSS